MEVGSASNGGSIIRFYGTLGWISGVTVEIEEEFDSIFRILEVTSLNHMCLVSHVRNVVNGIHLDRVSAVPVVFDRELVNGACFIWTFDHVFSLDGHG